MQVTYIVANGYAVFKKQRMPFKTYFDKTQAELRDKFGMEMCELPNKEKITMKEKLGE